MSFLEATSTGTPGEFRSAIGGHVTLYASAFAVMIYHYFGRLDQFDADHLGRWSEYLLEFQDPQSGLFIGPEIKEGPLLSAAHDPEHLALHSTCHVLPALNLLGQKPRYPLQYMDKFLDREQVRLWLDDRDWGSAWLEGNNLLFVGQLLTYIHEILGDDRASEPLAEFFKCLDEKVDVRTGLWGTDGHCNLETAIFGAYHQLILYYYWQHPVTSPEKLIDGVLSIQHKDGGFFQYWGGGSCQDVDSVDILVNMYKITDYRKSEIETALRKVSKAVLGRMTHEGGFVGMRMREFCHMGMAYTSAPENTANMFSTWFAVHTLFLVSELIDLPCTREIDYQYNDTASMGWHRKTRTGLKPMFAGDFGVVAFSSLLRETYFLLKKADFLYSLISRIYGIIKRR